LAHLICRAELGLGGITSIAVCASPRAISLRLSFAPWVCLGPMMAIRAGTGHVRLAPQYGQLFVESGTSGIDFGPIVLDQLLRAASDIARERRFLITR